MACPTCSHTMQSLGIMEDGMVHLCPRCGTLKTRGVTYVPKLVDRCRAFANVLDTADIPGGTPRGALKKAWEKVGIHESIRLPEERI